MPDFFHTLSQWLDFFKPYPAWLKVFAGIWVLFTVLLSSLLYAFKPVPMLVKIIDFRVVKNSGTELVLQLRIKNQTDAQVDLMALELEFYDKPFSDEDGLPQTTQYISGRYAVMPMMENGRIGTRVNDEIDLHNASVSVMPDDRPDYALLTLDLVQAVPPKGGDRFEVLVNVPGLPPKEAKTIKATVHFDEGQKTKPVEFKLSST